MKKRILLLIGISIMLSGCESSISQEDYNAKVTELETLQKDYDAKVAKLEATQKELDELKADNKEKATSETASESPVSFNEASSEELSAIPDRNDYTRVTAESLENIGVEEISDIHYGNYDYSGENNIYTYFFDSTCRTESDIELITRGMYISHGNKSKGWSIISIRNQENGIYYYIPEESKKYKDVYDYKTGNLISAKSEDFSPEKALEDFNKTTDAALKKGQEEIDKLMEEYGVK